MLDSIYHEKKINLKLLFGMKMLKFCHYVHNTVKDIIT